MKIGQASVVREFRADRISPPPSLSAFQAEWRERAPPRDSPLDLEIGCGVGWRSIRQARANPERTLIAVERTREKYEKFRGRLERNLAKRDEPLSNLFAVHADAVAFAVHAITEASLDRILLFYPNPCAKNPAARWFRMPFFGYLATRLKPGGEVILRTNLLGYADEARELAEEVWGLQVAGRRSFSRSEVDPREAATHFERKYLERGESCHELVLRKPD